MQLSPVSEATVELEAAFASLVPGGRGGAALRVRASARKERGDSGDVPMRAEQLVGAWGRCVN